jgi:alpha-L-fucosidase
MTGMDAVLRAAAVRPSPRQIAWQETEFYAFIHFNINAWTGREWGTGDEDPALFNPTGLDAEQWASVIEAGGMRGLILTAKHHDGFCLWPSALTDHSVKSSPWRGGRGDVVRDVSEACRRHGLKFGIYLSPWDKHEASYGDSPRYNAYFTNQLRELLTSYGEVFAVWFDGACGEGPNGKRQEYDWYAYYAVVRELQPNAVISVCGPDTRWCGNEAGHCRPSEWSVVPASLRDNEKIAEKSQQQDDEAFRVRFNSTDDDLGSRAKIAEVDDLVWYPAEVNISIRPGWFYHAEEDDQVRGLDELLGIYFNAVGGNATFLLNFPPDPRGLIHEHDAQRARELGTLLREIFERNLAQDASVSADPPGSGEHTAENILDGGTTTFWTPEDGQEQVVLTIDLPEPRTFNVAMLQEHIRSGQRIECFRLSALIDDTWRVVAESTVIGYKRLLRFAPVTAQRIRIEILESRIRPTLAAFGIFYHPKL